MQLDIIIEACVAVRLGFSTSAGCCVATAYFSIICSSVPYSTSAVEDTQLQQLSGRWNSRCSRGGVDPEEAALKINEKKKLTKMLLSSL